MPKNCQNGLKFEHNMHYGDSNNFLKFWQNLPKNGDLMAKKQAFFKFDGSIFFFFFTGIESSLRKMIKLT